MGWSAGFDPKWNRDIGYGVPATCDQPQCGAAIDRGLGHVCGGEPYGGEDGCGLFFCGEHLLIGSRRQQCERCENDQPPFEPTPDTAEWVEWKLTDRSWAEWRAENPAAVSSMKAALALDPVAETGEPSNVAIVFLVTGDILKPCSVAHSRHWSISPASAEEFAEEMTRIYGEPGQAMQPIEEVLTGEVGAGLVLLDPGEEAPDA